MFDFNSYSDEIFMNDFMDLYNLENFLINKLPTCFKKPENHSCIDRFLTNRPSCFQNSHDFETVISGFHKLVVAVLRTHFKKNFFLTNYLVK